MVSRWDPGQEMLDVWASIQMPKYADQIAEAVRVPGNQVRVHYDVDVGGSYGVKRGLKHAILIGFLARQLNRPVRLVEDRLDNMRGGDMQGPDRIFDVTLGFNSDATINTIEYEDIGIILVVTPHTNKEGIVTLDVAPEISASSGDCLRAFTYS